MLNRSWLRLSTGPHLPSMHLSSKDAQLVGTSSIEAAVGLATCHENSVMQCPTFGRACGLSVIVVRAKLAAGAPDNAQQE